MQQTSTAAPASATQQPARVHWLELGEYERAELAERAAFALLRQGFSYERMESYEKAHAYRISMERGAGKSI